jgi:SAM-dependent methyltransferase
MEEMKYLYELFEALPRCGPGNNESTCRAFSAIAEPPEQPLILDIGCGPGVQTIELARISNGIITALDNHQPFLDTLLKAAREAGVEKNIVTKNMSMLDMDFEKNTFDIIWSEGALYCMGFRSGLRKCHQLLKDGGYLAVSECVYLASGKPEPVTKFFDREYPEIKDIKGNIELIQNEGFALLSHFTLPESAWLDSYYLPMEEELVRLTKKYTGKKIASNVFEQARQEIEIYKKYSRFYGYEFFIMKKTNLPSGKFPRQGK